MEAATVKLTRINFRTDEKTKEEANELFAKLGLDMSTALNMFLKQTIHDQGLPFAPSLRDVPNEETRRAMVEAEAKMMGLIEDDSPRFTNAKDAMNWLNEEA